MSLKLEGAPAVAPAMTIYEVHISPEPGVVVPFRVIQTGMSLRSEGSLFLRTADRACAEHCRQVVDDTSRRSDDNQPWIREVEE